MYLWVILAAFLATMAAYLLPFRNDMSNVVDTPVADSVLMQMVMQHKAALLYMEKNTYTDGTHCPPRQISPPESCVAYSGGVMNDDLIKQNIDFGIGYAFNTNYSHKIYCVCNDADYNNPNYTPSDCNTRCRNNSLQPLRGLLTVGPIPHHWLYYTADKVFPSDDLSSAMRKRLSKEEMAGYIVNRGDQYKFYIHNYYGNEFAIPNEFNDIVGDCVSKNDACFGYLTFK